MRSAAENSSPGLQKAARLALALLVLIGVGSGGFVAYRKYSAFRDEERRLALAKKEEDEIKQFSPITFNADIYSYADISQKLPARFRVAPPEPEALNAFPYREKVVGKLKSAVKATGYRQPTYQKGRGLVGGGQWTNWSDPEEARMLSVRRILKYTYSKNAVRQLVVDVDFVGVFQIIKAGDSCPGDRDACVYSILTEGTGKLRVIRTGDGWEFDSVEGSCPNTRIIMKWNKDTDAVIERDPAEDLKPTYEYTDVLPLPKPSGDE